jgi:hypothetical protein
MGINKAFALILIASAARAQVAAVPPATGKTPTVDAAPPLNLEYTPEAAEIKLRKAFGLGQWTLTPSLRAGELAPNGRLPGSLPSTLRTSPYFGGDIQLSHTGSFESMIAADAAHAQINSAKDYSDPSGQAGSNAVGDRPDKASTGWIAFSQYADMGKLVQISDKVKAAFYASTSFSAMHRAGEMTAGVIQHSLGTVWSAKAGAGEVTTNVDLRMDQVRHNMYNNDLGALAPAATAGAEYAQPLGGLRASAGVQTAVQRADVGVRPYVGLSNERLAALVAVEERRSRDPFYPNVRGVAAQVSAVPRNGVTVSVEGRYERAAYAMAAKPTNDFTLSGQVSLDVNRLMHATVAARKTAQNPKTDYRPADSYAMNARLPGPDYAPIFEKALRESASFEEFAARIPAKGTDGVLSAVSAFAASFGALNYNEKMTDNVTDVNELYRRGRDSYLTGNSDPILICIGSAQFTARLVQALSARAGVNLQAAAVDVSVPGSHAVTAVRTPEYGIVFVDWGRLTPTHTLDTKEAFAVFQALQGVPEVYHKITGGPEGHHIGYLFTPEGKAFERRLTVQTDLNQAPVAALFNDVVSGPDAAAERYRRLLIKKP